MGETKRRRKRGLPPGEAEALAADLKRRLVELANVNDAAMDGTMGSVLEIIADNEVVYGVWQDPTEPDGVGTLIIKGANFVHEIAASGKTQECRLTAIKCIAAEQAEALRLHVNTDLTH